MKNAYHAQLRREGWNTQPKNRYVIPSSTNALINASRAIAVSAYPDPKHHLVGGRAERYSNALLAYVVRIAKLSGNIDALPTWATKIKVESMERNLATGYRNLLRAFTIRDLIASAEIMKTQYEQSKRSEKTTFTIQYAEDLSKLEITIPIEDTVSGYLLSGSIPDTKLASLRAAILHHRLALRPFAGPAVKEDGRDPEVDYQNTYNRYVRPALFAQHIVQVVWHQGTKCASEANRRGLPVDQVLMRQPDWASDIHLSTSQGLAVAIHRMRHLGVPTCWCEMVRFSEPLPDS